jgi:hypothetical protein
MAPSLGGGAAKRPGPAPPGAGVAHIKKTAASQQQLEWGRRTHYRRGAAPTQNQASAPWAAPKNAAASRAGGQRIAGRAAPLS